MNFAHLNHPFFSIRAPPALKHTLKKLSDIATLISRKSLFMRTLVFFLLAGGFCCFFAAGCTSAAERFCESTGNKNIGIDGYVMYSTVDTADTTTGTPVGKLILGRLVYKSRKVGIPADQKVPHTGNFKFTKTRTLFGTEEHIVEYDFTADSASGAEAAAARLDEIKETLMAEKEK